MSGTMMNSKIDRCACRGDVDSRGRVVILPKACWRVRSTPACEGTTFFCRVLAGSFGFSPSKQPLPASGIGAVVLLRRSVRIIPAISCYNMKKTLEIRNDGRLLLR